MAAADGYYVRTRAGETQGPLCEEEFERVLRTPSGRRVVGARDLQETRGERGWGGDKTGSGGGWAKLVSGVG